MSGPTIADLIILVGDPQKRVIELTEEKSRLKARVAELEAQTENGLAELLETAVGRARHRRRSRCASGPTSMFIVFADRMSAEAFAADVRGNIENQALAGVTNLSLDLAEVAATT
jgi:hypothetical protein